MWRRMDRTPPVLRLPLGHETALGHESSWGTSPLGGEPRLCHHALDDSPPVRRMLITLFTDASHCGKTHVAAYAVWGKADGRTVRRAGVLKEPVPDSSVAEAQALVNGLCFVLAALRPDAGSKII